MSTELEVIPYSLQDQTARISTRGNGAAEYVETRGIQAIGAYIWD